MGKTGENIAEAGTGGEHQGGGHQANQQQDERIAGVGTHDNFTFLDNEEVTQKPTPECDRLRALNGTVKRKLTGDGGASVVGRR